VPFPIKNRITGKAKTKSNVKGIGQECPIHTGMGAHAPESRKSIWRGGASHSVGLCRKRLDRQDGRAKGITIALFFGNFLLKLSLLTLPETRAFDRAGYRNQFVCEGP
jgi:hypothetical protein